jgi:hypothetical protein
MPRPKYDVARARKLLRPWLAARVEQTADEAPITRNGAVEFLNEQGLQTSLSTLNSHGLSKLVSEAVIAQANSARSRWADEEEAAYQSQLGALRAENERLLRHNRDLLAEIATMTFNARRLGVKHEEITRSIPKADRSRSNAGRRAPTARSR